MGRRETYKRSAQAEMMMMINIDTSNAAAKLVPLSVSLTSEVRLSRLTLRHRDVWGYWYYLFSHQSVYSLGVAGEFSELTNVSVVRVTGRVFCFVVT